MVVSWSQGPARRQIFAGHRRACREEADIEKRVHPHVFRHSFTTRLLESGLDVSSVQSLLGHAMPETASHCSHVARPRDYRRRESPLGTMMACHNRSR
ncbi:tyrosine-type recombinase/integrase [Candidatus Woesearchaeota archaeon]|nr:tyrosine-type recombinase/integrase [Candidatus Woesearchaeota archaeon]